MREEFNLLAKSKVPAWAALIAEWLKSKNYIFKGEGDTISPYDKVSLMFSKSKKCPIATNFYGLVMPFKITLKILLNPYRI